MKPCLTILLFLWLTYGAWGQSHHPPEDEEIHKRFYATWFMPDDPHKSCCSDQDCYPTTIRYSGSQLYARRREDGAWMIVPPSKIERNRDNPDGRNHVCALPPNHSRAGTVLCFILGTGG